MQAHIETTQKRSAGQGKGMNFWPPFESLSIGCHFFATRKQHSVTHHTILFITVIKQDSKGLGFDGDNATNLVQAAMWSINLLYLYGFSKNNTQTKAF